MSYETSKKSCIEKRILKQKMHSTKTRVFSRETNVKQIDSIHNLKFWEEKEKTKEVPN